MADAPQFGTAEYQQEDGDRCKTCNTPVTAQYFRVNGAMTCAPCAESTANMLPKDSHSVFVRGLVFGGIGAVLGLTLYSVVGIVTGLEIGYVSLAVGYIVARAVLFGTAGISGRRYQVAAVLLTYLAVSMSAVPIGLWQATHSEESQATQETAIPGVDAKADSAVADEAQPSLIGVALMLAGLGLISPLLGLTDPLSGLIGLVILFVGLQIAWKTTAGNPVQVMGPYNA